jgi:hypothetical protein
LSFLSDGLQTFCLAEITKRNDTSFGVMKMHKTVEGQTDSFEGGDPSTLLTQGLQVVQPS